MDGQKIQERQMDDFCPFIREPIIIWLLLCGSRINEGLYLTVTFPLLVVTASFFFVLVPGGYIPRLESKKRECWKFLDKRLNSENDSRLHGQPSNASINNPEVDREDANTTDSTADRMSHFVFGTSGTF